MLSVLQFVTDRAQELKPRRSTGVHEDAQERVIADSRAQDRMIDRDVTNLAQIVRILGAERRRWRKDSASRLLRFGSYTCDKFLA